MDLSDITHSIIFYYSIWQIIKIITPLFVLSTWELHVVIISDEIEIPT